MHYITMIPGSFYIIFLVFAGIVLLVLAYGLFSSPLPLKKKKGKTFQKGFAGEPGVCPLCETILTNGQQIKSALFPGESTRICHIFGCPNCYPYKDASLHRTCPVCKKTIPQEEYLFARLFERQNKKRHVHILGCSSCRLPRKR